MPILLGETADVVVAEAIEREAPPGLVGVRFHTLEPIIEDNLQDMEDYLYQNGVDVRAVHQRKKGGLYYVEIVYNKPVPSEAIAALPIAIIPLIAFGFIIALVGFGIWHMEDITNNIGKLLLIIFGGTIVIVALARKPLEAAATGYLERKF